jgi:hypothetical protein
MEKCNCRFPTMDGVITCHAPYKHKGIQKRNFHRGFVAWNIDRLPNDLKVVRTELGNKVAYWKVKEGEL